MPRGGMNCAVASCKNSYYKTNKLDDVQSINYHRFPRNEGLRKLWIEACKRKDSFNVDTSYVCSTHFKAEDFHRNLKAEFGLSIKKNILKADAIPTRKLLKSVSPKHSPTSRTMRQQVRQRKEVIQVLFKEHNNTSENIAKITKEQEESVQESPAVEVSYDTYIKLKNNYDQLKKDYEDLLVKSDQEIKRLNLMLKQKDEEFCNRMRECLSSFLTETQIDLVLKLKKQAKEWNSEDIGIAVALRFLSKKCYIYLRNTLHYPLSGLSTLKRWVASLNLRNGILFDVLKIMGAASIKYTDRERATVLSFDEMKVDESLEYDKKDDAFVGPYKQMQVVMARGLFAKWKQPVFIKFDTKITKYILFEVINHLKQIGYQVVAVVCDSGPTNRCLYKELEITPEKSWFEISDLRIHCFADTPHLLKLLRNHFLDDGFKLSNGETITTACVKRLIDGTKNLEVSSLFKLSELHLNLKRHQRQNVRMAAELISHTTATALRHYKLGDQAEYTSTADFIDIVNQWFDIFNSRTPQSSISHKAAFGIHYDQQKQTIEDFKQIISDMRTMKSSSLLPFQNGIIMNINSLDNLYLDMRTKFGISYLLGYKLNQDCLENLFSQIRTRGGLHDHPSPSCALYRLRLIILGKSLGQVKQNTDIEYVEEEFFLIGEVLKKCSVKVHVNESTELKTDCPSNLLNNTSSSTCSSSDNNNEASNITEEASRDGLQYLAGWVAKKFHTQYPFLGDYTYKMRESEHTYSVPPWIIHLSFGGLMQPTDQWMDVVQEMEKIFINFFIKHGLRITHPLHELKSKCVAKFPNIPSEVVNTYLLQRIYIRVKYINHKNLLPKLKKQEERKFRKICH